MALEEIMNPTFVVASQDVDKDAPFLRKTLEELQKETNYQQGYTISDKGTLAAGWCFYEVFLKPEFMEKIIQSKNAMGKKIKNERDILEMLQSDLTQGGSGAKIRLYKDKPLFIRWWKWILK
ncbi:MAG: hypothetical protein WAN47_03400 [Nitrosotalea sp.]